jgi:hypothetical protein
MNHRPWHDSRSNESDNSQMKRRAGLRLVVATALIITGCSSAGAVDGPVLTSPRPALWGAGGLAAILEGTLTFDGDCLRLIQGDIEYLVVWPAGASWEPDPPSVVLDGQTIEPGTTVSGEGGYLTRDHVEQLAGSQVADAAARCAGPTGEIAFFNIGSQVEVTSG